MRVNRRTSGGVRRSISCFLYSMRYNYKSPETALVGSVFYNTTKPIELYKKYNQIKQIVAIKIVGSNQKLICDFGEFVENVEQSYKIIAFYTVTCYNNCKAQCKSNEMNPTDEVTCCAFLLV